MKGQLIVSAIAASLLAFAGAAQAHVTIHPNALPAGGEATVVVSVPNEQANASTVSLVVKFPAGFVSLQTEPVPGWRATVTTRKLTTPIQTDEGPVSFQVDRVTWTATGKGIAPGHFLRFPFSAAAPGRPGAVLSFKVLQTYSNGKVVRWIGPPEAGEPAARVMVMSAGSALADYPAGISAIKKARKTESHTPLLAFALGLPALGLAGLGLAVRRRSRQR